jgi:hypothetical protein
MTSKLLLTLLLSVLLTCCRSTNDSAQSLSVAERLQKGIDWDNRPLPKDRKNLSIAAPEGTVRFIAPDGWHIQDQPGFNKLSYTLTHEGTFGDIPSIRVEMFTGFAKDYYKKRPYHTRLNDIHSNFPSAKFKYLGSVSLADGRAVEVAEYIDGDVPELTAFITESDYITSFTLLAHDRTTLMNNRSSFEAVIKSYRSH